MKLKIIDDYVFDDSCINLLVEHLKEFIILHAKKYTEDGFDIWLHENGFRIRYKNHIYSFTIIRKHNQYYYYLYPYNKSYFLTLTITGKEFEMILQAIKDNHNMLYEERK